MDFMAHPEEALHWGSEVFPSKSDFEAMVRSYLVNNMGIKLTKDANLMESLWFPDQSADQTHPGKPLFFLGDLLAFLATMLIYNIGKFSVFLIRK